MEREACVCDRGFERSDLCAEIIIIIIKSDLSNPCSQTQASLSIPSLHPKTQTKEEKERKKITDEKTSPDLIGGEGKKKNKSKKKKAKTRHAYPRDK